MTTFGQHLINETLPERYQIDGPLTKKNLAKTLVRFAKENPHDFPDAVHNLKRVGDEIATYEGLSVGLDDVAPMYEDRKKLLTWAEKHLAGAKNPSEYGDRMLDVQSMGTELSRKHPGTMNLMVRSGGRGKDIQLMKTVVAPMLARDPKGRPYPYLIDRSFSEGLTPGQYWVAANESRQDMIQTYTASSLPGDLGKRISATLNNVQITRPDCGTHNGLPMEVDDHHILDRYLADDSHGLKRNTLITDQLVRSLKKKRITSLIVRSPLTCNESPGICQKCYGLNEKGALQNLGTHIGLRSAQALSEPLTQLVISAKHGSGALKAEDELPAVLGVNQLVSIPESFKGEALLSTTNWSVERIEAAPQGGHFIYIAGIEHYAMPTRTLKVKKGSTVRKGDALTNGNINPKQLIETKGLGAGRDYLVNKMHSYYAQDNIDVDRRHFELAAKQLYNWVTIDEPGPHGEYLPGDVVSYNVLKDGMKKKAKTHPVNKDIIGQFLAKEALYFTAGTEVTEEIYSKLKQAGIREVHVTRKGLKYTPVVRPLDQIPLLSEDWVSRLGHRRLKDTILSGAAFGSKSHFSGGSPYPSSVYSPDYLNEAVVDIDD